MEIIIASHNQHKVEEIRSIIGADRLILRSLNDVGYHDEIVEDGATLQANAWIKANAIHGLYGGNVMSDDTGLEVDALDGAPGVISARFAGPQRDHEDNMDKLLSMLSQHDNRKAQFRTIVALHWQRQRHEFEGIIRGKISFSRSGSGGFGYDPIFVPDGYDKSFGELSPHTKNRISHRALAFDQVKKFILSQL